MRKLNKPAFTISEVLMAMGIIGVLAITMLSLNNFSNNGYNVAATKLAQADSALKSWGKAQTNSGETGLGLLADIQSQTDLDKVILKAFNANKGVTGDNATIQLSGNEKIVKENTISGSHSITLDNGVVLTSKYLTSSCDVSNGQACAVITLSTKVNGVDLVEEYGIFSEGVKDSASIFEGYEQHKIYQNGDKTDAGVVVDCGEGVTRCYIPSDCKNECGSTGTTNPVPANVPTNATNFYTNSDSTQPCPNANSTGNITITTVATLTGGKVQTPIDRCCPSPQVYSDTKQECVCDSAKITLTAGYVFNAAAETCQTACPKGTYLKEEATSCSACAKGAYCSQEAMTTVNVCPKGSYCPATGAENDKNYCAVSYRQDEKGNILEGGLINKIICTKGNYCPEDGAIAETQCEAGTYCPDEGMTAPIKCPAGTFSAKTGATDSTTCQPCAINTYSDKAGSSVCTACSLGGHTNGKKGATFCTGCPEGSYYTGSGCALCPKGTYSATSGATACTPCKGGTFSAKAGATSCAVCPVGNYSPELKKGATVGATACTACSAGKYQDKTGQTSCTDCAAGSYSKNSGAAKCTLCKCGTYQPEKGKTSFVTVDAGKYASMTGGDIAYVNIGANTVRACLAGHACPGLCQAPIQCKEGFFSAFADGTATSTNATQCALCLVGHYCPTPGLSAPKPCECDTYQPEKGKTACISVPAGNYPLKAGSNNYVDSGATGIEICPEGSYCPGDISNAACDGGLIACEIGKYSARTGATECTLCACGTYTDKKGQISCREMKAGTYFGEKGSGQYEGIACTGDAAATAETYCPAGSCAPKTSCPRYDSIYIVTDGHGHATKLNELLNTFTCINRDKIIKDDMYTEWIERTVTGGYIFIMAKTDGEFRLIDVTVWKYNTYDLKNVNGDYLDNQNAYKYSNKGVVQQSTCGGHSSSLAGGTITKIYDDVPCNYNMSLFGKVYSPLVLDLKGDDLNFTSIEDGVNFDLAHEGKDEEGKAIKTAWTPVQRTFDDAFLCYDKNNNGLIDDGSELFGDQNGAENGFKELEKYDENNDGIINAKDAIYSDLLLWVDFNKDGVVNYTTEKDYELLKEQTDNGQNFNDNNLHKTDGVYKYYVKRCIEDKPKKQDDNGKGQSKADVKIICKWGEAAKATPPENGKTIELRPASDYLESLNIAYEIKKANDSENIAKDENNNIIGMVGSFVGKVVGSSKDIIETFIGKMIDVWFQVDNN